MTVLPSCSSWPTPSHDPGRLPTPVSGTEKPPGAPAAAVTPSPSPGPRWDSMRWDTGRGAKAPRCSNCCMPRPDSSREQDGPLTLRSQVTAALAREMRHGTIHAPDADVVDMAVQAVDLATAAGDAHAVAVAKLALQDAMWRPGTAAARLPVIAEMLAAASASGDADLVAEAHLLRAAALIELGDPTGRRELASYISLAEGLGHARGRWGALTRRATLAQLIGRADEAAQLAEQALELGQAIGEPDALACFCTSRWALVALGVPEPQLELESFDPLWPMFPIFQAWPHAARGDASATAAALGDFSVLDIAEATGTEGLAAAAVVFAVAGTTGQRSWTYERLRPLAGTHVIVAGCASYHAAVDHHLGALAASLGNTGGSRAALPRRDQAARTTRRRGLGATLRGGPDAPDDPSRGDDQRVPPRQRAVASRLQRTSRPAGRLQGPARSRPAHRRPGQRRPRLHPSRPGATSPRRRPDPRRHSESAVPDPTSHPRRPDRRR